MKGNECIFEKDTKAYQRLVYRIHQAQREEADIFELKKLQAIEKKNSQLNNQTPRSLLSEASNNLSLTGNKAINVETIIAINAAPTSCSKNTVDAEQDLKQTARTDSTNTVMTAQTDSLTAQQTVRTDSTEYSKMKITDTEKVDSVIQKDLRLSVVKATQSLNFSLFKPSKYNAKTSVVPVDTRQSESRMSSINCTKSSLNNTELGERLATEFQEGNSDDKENMN